MVYRMRWRLRTRLGFTALSILLVLAFVMPYARGAWLREAAVIMVYFPLLVALGAGTTVTPKTQTLCRFLGELSYPLYMTHYAVIWIWGDYAEKHRLIAGRLWPAVALGVLLMAVFAWAVFRFYDQPVRRYLRAKCFHPC